MRVERDKDGKIRIKQAVNMTMIGDQSVSGENREKRTLKKIIFLCGDSVTQNSRRMWQQKINRRQLKPLAIWVATCASAL
jgi:hypothetical protein